MRRAGPTVASIGICSMVAPPCAIASSAFFSKTFSCVKARKGASCGISGAFSGSAFSTATLEAAAHNGPDRCWTGFGVYPLVLCHLGWLGTAVSRLILAPCADERAARPYQQVAAQAPFSFLDCWVPLQKPFRGRKVLHAAMAGCGCRGSC